MGPKPAPVIDKPNEVSGSSGDYRKTIDTISILAWCSLPDGSHESQPERWLAFTGLSAEQSQGLGWAVAIHPDDNFPDYGVGLRLTIPLRNRTARADVVRDQLAVRQQQIRLQQLQKQVRLEITNALIGVEEARDSFQAARSERILQEQTLAAEREKLEVGASTGFYVVQYQRDLAAAKSAEVSALASYQKAKATLERATGTILDDYGVKMDEAVRAVVSRNGRE